MRLSTNEQINDLYLCKVLCIYRMFKILFKFGKENLTRILHIFTCSVMKMIFNQGGRINTNECIGQTCFDGEIRLKCHSFYVFTTLLSYGYYNYHSDSEKKTLISMAID